MAVKQGDTVVLDYEGKLESGEVFDSSKHGDHDHPLEFEVGNQQVIKGFEDSVLGMEKGEEKEFSIEPKEAYGMPKKELVREIPKEQMNLKGEPQKGSIIIAHTPDGRKIPLKVDDVKENSLVIDMNHPLAGKKLFFKIKLLEIKDSK
ncbi:peptidylprolyl isomerase [Candidatus Pacearchaeota archaeon]|nr:peptidylprolyl isomerase [Candidatus Pacearchaeota archaeon]MBD3283615.1 peptidylprolyl isomerase [Candidatus Pacearchaeota archaeon]